MANTSVGRPVASDDYCGVETSKIATGLSAAFIAFDDNFQSLRLPLNISICVFGILTNVLHAFVMRRHQNTMFSTINNLLSSLAVSQTLLLLSFMTMTILLPTSTCVARFRSFTVVNILLVATNTSVVFHTAAIGHVTCLALFRYAMMRWPVRFFRKKGPPSKKSINICTIHCESFSIFNQSVLIPLIYITVTVLCTPFYLNSDVRPVSNATHTHCNWPKGVQLYTISTTDLSRRSGLNVVNRWLFSIVFKLVPCVLIVLLNVLLIFKLRQVQNKRARLLNTRRRSQVDAEDSFVSHEGGRAVVALQPASSHRERRSGVAKVLLVVVLLFFIVEFAQATMNLMFGVCGRPFQRMIYRPLMDFLDMLTALYSSVSFALYCLMSSEYRETLKECLCQVACRNRRDQERSASVAPEERSLTDDGRTRGYDGTQNGDVQVSEGYCRKQSTSFNLHDRRPSAEIRRCVSECEQSQAPTFGTNERVALLRSGRKFARVDNRLSLA